MKKQRRICLGLLLLLAAMLLPCGTTVFAKNIANGKCGKKLTWKLDNKGTLTISGSGEMTDFVNDVGEAPWQKYATDGKIKKLVLKKGLTNITPFAFVGCQFTQVSIPSTVKEIGPSAFENCYKLKTVTIPAATKEIGVDPIAGGEIPPTAFSWCQALKSIKVAKGNKYFCSVNGVLYNKKKTELVYYPAGKTSSSFTIPSSVTTIRAQAFAVATKLTSVTIGTKVKKVGYEAFYGCEKLKNITIKTKKLSATNLGYDAFYGISSSVTFKVPSSKMAAYKKLLKNCCSSEKIKYKKL